jgi:LETM1 and EF-hand domain-containing protein 1
VLSVTKRLMKARWQLHSEPLEEDTRMTTEQLKELVEVLSVLSAKSSVLKERDELHNLMEENQRAASEEAEVLHSLI